MKLITLFIALFLSTVTVYADDIVVSDAWIREAPPNAFALAGYMTLDNVSKNNQTLVSAESVAFDSVMIHRTVHENGLARMKHQKAVIVPAGGSVKFEPNGYHLMLMQPLNSLKSGDTISINLMFSNKLSHIVEFNVRRGSAMKSGKGKCGGMKCGGGKGDMKCGGG